MLPKQKKKRMKERKKEKYLWLSISKKIVGKPLFVSLLASKAEAKAGKAH